MPLLSAVSKKDLQRIEESIIESSPAMSTPQGQKALAIYKSVTYSARQIYGAVNSLPKYKLPRIATAAHRRRTIAYIKLYTTIAIEALHIRMVAGQPVPKRPDGWKHSPGGLALLDNSTEPPLIEKLDSAILSLDYLTGIKKTSND